MLLRATNALLRVARRPLSATFFRPELDSAAAGGGGAGNAASATTLVATIRDQIEDPGGGGFTLYVVRVVVNVVLLVGEDAGSVVAATDPWELGRRYSAFEALRRALEAADDAQSATGGYANRLYASLGDGGAGLPSFPAKMQLGIGGWFGGGSGSSKGGGTGDARQRGLQAWLSGLLRGRHALSPAQRVVLDDFLEVEARTRHSKPRRRRMRAATAAPRKSQRPAALAPPPPAEAVEAPDRTAGTDAGAASAVALTPANVGSGTSGADVICTPGEHEQTAGIAFGKVATDSALVARAPADAISARQQEVEAEAAAVAEAKVEAEGNAAAEVMRGLAAEAEEQMAAEQAQAANAAAAAAAAAAVVAEAEAEAAAAASAAAEPLVARLHRYYAQHNPVKLQQESQGPGDGGRAYIAQLLLKFQGREAVLCAKLEKRYGAPLPVTLDPPLRLDRQRVEFASTTAKAATAAAVAAAAAPALGVAAARAASMRKRLVSFYTVHNPAKLQPLGDHAPGEDGVHAVMRHYAGREDVLFFRVLIFRQRAQCLKARIMPP